MSVTKMWKMLSETLGGCSNKLSGKRKPKRKARKVGDKRGSFSIVRETKALLGESYGSYADSQGNYSPDAGDAYRNLPAKVYCVHMHLYGADAVEIIAKVRELGGTFNGACCYDTEQRPYAYDVKDAKDVPIRPANIKACFTSVQNSRSFETWYNAQQYQDDLGSTLFVVSESSSRAAFLHSELRDLVD